MPLPDLTDIELDRPRRVAEILSTALRLYGRAPLLFMFLTAVAVVPYEVVVLVLTNRHGSVRLGTELVLALVALALIQPCVVTLQMQVLLELRNRRRPSLRAVFESGLMVLPMVAAAEIIAAIGIAIGAILFVIPGVILYVRLAVVSPAAAAERSNWPTSLRRSVALTHGNAWRTLGLLVIVFLLNEIPASISGGGTQVAADVVGVLLAVVFESFAVLLVNLLYFDLSARERAPAV